jgi:hypothetical protein
MAHSLLNLFPILRGVVTLPRQGVWHADLVIDADEAPTGQVSLRIGSSLTLVGTVLPQGSGVFAGEVRVRVVGGQGRLGTELPPRWYQGAPRELPLRDLCDEAGERLSTTTDATLLAEVLSPGWARVRGTASAALGRLLEGTGASWRILPDGSLWVGPETWPAATGMADLVVMDEDRSRGRLVVVSEAPTLLPGQTLRGDRVSDVEITIEPEQIRIEAWLERPTPGLSIGDRFKGALLAIIDQLVRRRTDYLGWHDGTVLAVDAAGRLEVKLDDPDSTDERPPLTGVQVRAGVPGLELKLKIGCRVQVSWEGGNPRRPIARPYDPAGLDEVRVVATTKVVVTSPSVVLDETTGRQLARLGDLVAVGGPTTVLTLVPIPNVSPPGPVVPGAPYAVVWSRLDNPAATGTQLFGSILSGNAKVKG